MLRMVCVCSMLLLAGCETTSMMGDRLESLESRTSVLERRVDDNSAAIANARCRVTHVEDTLGGLLGFSQSKKDSTIIDPPEDLTFRKPDC
jgi:uncharacterized coiled-coil protein SlyX